jgi:hypothetical protein
MTVPVTPPGAAPKGKKSLTAWFNAHKVESGVAGAIAVAAYALYRKSHPKAAAPAATGAAAIDPATGQTYASELAAANQATLVPTQPAGDWNGQATVAAPAPAPPVSAGAPLTQGGMGLGPTDSATGQALTASDLAPVTSGAGVEYSFVPSSAAATALEAAGTSLYYQPTAGDFQVYPWGQAGVAPGTPMYEATTT